MNLVKDLTKEPPRSPRVRIGGYPFLARMADKGRAFFLGTPGEYHFDCPLDRMLFSFKGVSAEEVKPLLTSGATDEEIADWFNQHGTQKTPEEITAWGNEQEQFNPSMAPDKKEWFAGVCQELGLNPEETTLFEYLEADDKATFAAK